MRKMMTSDEAILRDHWINRLFTSNLPIDFSFGEEKIGKLLPSFDLNEDTDAGSAIFNKRRYNDAKTGLEISVDIKKYPDFPCVEWVAHLKNTGTADSPVIDNLQALDMHWIAERSLCGDTDSPVVRYASGARGGEQDFMLMETALEPGGSLTLAAKGGKSSSFRMPYYNLHWGSQGVIVMIGWSGQWAASIVRETTGHDLLLRAGLERTHFILHPGEEIRTPSIALLFWTGELQRSHNMLRRFIVSYHSPEPVKMQMSLPVSCPSWGGMKTINHLRKIAYIKDNGISINNYWIDAGWFGPPHEAEEYQNLDTEDWYGLSGDWRVNKYIHPDGLKIVSDTAHAAGMTFMLWIEPERAVMGTPVTLEHPEWLIPHPPSLPKFDVGKYKDVASSLVNLGIPEARKWITDFVSERIEKEGIDVYRQDMNAPLLKYLESCDSQDRIGMAEMKYIEGLYCFIDDLLKRHPGLLIDNCAGGGTRLDIEMVSRSVCLHRTDYVCYPESIPAAVQAQGTHIMYWLPFTCSGIGSFPGDTYRFRSEMGGGANIAIGTMIGRGSVDISLPEIKNGDWYRKMLEDHSSIKDMFAYDFYPLTDCNLSTRNWHAFQLDSPEQARGAIFAFRRDESPYTTAVFNLSGLDEQLTYELVDIDSGERKVMTGEALMKQGLMLCMPDKRDSRIIKYRNIV